MKKILFVLTLLFGFVVTMNAQDRTYPVQIDTATCVAAADTIDWVIPATMDYPGYFEYSAIADSLSGATGGTLYVYTASEYSADIDDWFLDTSYTINGTTTSIQLQDRLYHEKIWFRAIFPSSTQSTRLRQWFTWKNDRR